MALTLLNKTDTYQKRQRVIDHLATKLKVTVVDITFDSSYPRGGEAIDADDIGHGFNEIVSIHGNPSTGASYGYILSWNSSTEKLVVLETDSDYAGDRSLKEVANATNLSAATFKCFVTGY